MSSNEKTLEKTLKVYDFIKDFTSKNGFSPSIRDICNAMDISSTATVSYYLNKLDDLGYIKKLKNKNRALEILSDNKNEVAKVPILNEEMDYSYNSNTETKMIEISKGLLNTNYTPNFVYIISKNDIFDAKFCVDEKIFLLKMPTYIVNDYVMAKIDNINYIGKVKCIENNLFLVVKKLKFNISDCYIIGKIVNVVKNL